MAGRRGYADNALDAIDTAGLSDDSKRELGALKKAYYDIRGQLSVSSQVGRRPPPRPAFLIRFFMTFAVYMSADR